MLAIEDVDKTYPGGVHALANLHEQTGRSDFARKLYRAALNGPRPNPRLLLHASRFERRNGAGEEAVELLTRAAAIEPGDLETACAGSDYDEFRSSSDESGSHATRRWRGLDSNY